MPIISKRGLVITSEVRAGVGYMRLVDAISEYGESSSSAVRSQVDSFLSQGITQAEVYVNGRGGDCFEATEMVNELERIGNDNVSLKVGTLAASAYTYLVAKFFTRANANSLFMIHKPNLGTYGNIESIEADLVLLRKTTDMYRAAYAAKMKKTEADIDAMWEKGDVWLTAQEALELGLIDAIDGNEELEVTAQDRTVLQAMGAPTIPELTTPTTTSSNIMEKKELIALLGLSADATDEQIKAAITAQKEKAAEHDQQTETAEQKAAKAAKTLVAKHVKRKALNAELAEGYEKWAKMDFASCEAALDAMVPIPQLSAQLNAGALNEATIEARAAWSFDEWQEKDPKGLEAYAESNPEDFQKLFNAQYQ